VPDATSRFRAGAIVEVDGATGEVTILIDPDSPAHGGAPVLTGGAR
jgi:hypothetical protein